MNNPLGIIDAIVLGLVEGITEALPVSSTGHLVVTASLLGLDSPDTVKTAMDTLLIVIQGGAILAVLWLFRKSVCQMILELHLIFQIITILCQFGVLVIEKIFGKMQEVAIVKIILVWLQVCIMMKTSGP